MIQRIPSHNPGSEVAAQWLRLKPTSPAPSVTRRPQDAAPSRLKDVKQHQGSARHPREVKPSAKLMPNRNLSRPEPFQRAAHRNVPQLVPASSQGSCPQHRIGTGAPAKPSSCPTLPRIRPNAERRPKRKTREGERPPRLDARQDLKSERAPYKEQRSGVAHPV